MKALLPESQEVRWILGGRAEWEQAYKAGPVGLRGPGETQLELDRRQARRRIAVLKRELEEVRTQRRQQSKQRERAGVPVVAIVGYTNAGKSSLLNALTGAQVLVQDKLFATLDPTTRRLTLPGGREALLTDTVGFIRKLPHDLVAAFQATLEGGSWWRDNFRIAIAYLILIAVNNHFSLTGFKPEKLVVVRMDFGPDFLVGFKAH